MKKIEAEWQMNEINNRLQNFRSEEGLMATEAFSKGMNFEGTLKGANNEKLAEQKVKTQDVSEILRKAK